MKILITENQFQLISETIHPSEAYRNIDAARTVCDGKRNVAFMAGLSYSETEEVINLINEYDLDSIRVPSSSHNAYIIFRKGHDKQAYKLLNVAEKYGGYLSWKATDEDTREIGRLLEYHPEEVEEYIKKNRN
jgi:hypothetical protein